MTSEYTRSLSELDYVFAAGISYNTTTPEMIKNLGAFEINYNNVESTSRSSLAEYEHKFGPEESSSVCDQCSSRECQGHLGYIRFPETASGDPVMIYNPMFMSLIKKIFGMLCMSCCRLAIDKNDPWFKNRIAEILTKPRATRVNALDALIGASSQKYTECVHYTKIGDRYLVCSAKKKITLSNKTDLSTELVPAHEGRGKRETTTQECSELTDEDITSRKRRKQLGTQGTVQDTQARTVYEVFQYLGGGIGFTEDCELLGITKEDVNSYFMDGMFLIPTMYRPKSAGGSNEITRQYQLIINLCAEFKRAQPASSKKMTELIPFQKALQAAVFTYHQMVGNMLGKKKGIFRGNIFGKRPDYNARTVIVPSRYSDINTIEVPEVAASLGLTKRIDITEENIEAMQELFFNGKVAYVRKLYGRDQGKIVHVATDNCTDTSRHILQVGDMIWRHMQDGDLLVAGRQPTMNKHNVFAARAKIVPGNTTAININSTPGLAADFDGDTMWMFIVQLAEAEEDLDKMLLGKHVRSSQKGAPMYGLTYNAVVAACVLTIQRLEITPELWSTCIDSYQDSENLRTLDARLAKYGVPKYSGRALFSTTLPADFSYVGGEGIKRVVIKQGVLVSGMLSSSTVSASSGSIVDQMSIEYHPDWEVTFNFINAATFMLAEFISAFGFSVTYTDCIFGQNEAVSALLEERMENAEHKILKLRRPETHYERIKYEKDVLSIVHELKSVALKSGTFAVNPKESDFLERMAEYIDEDAVGTLAEVDINSEGMSDDTLNDLAFMVRYLPADITVRRRENPLLELLVERVLEEVVRDPRTAVSQLANFKDKLSYVDVYIDVSITQNNLIFMSKLLSGQKGNEGNLTSLGLELGQQQVMGMRLPRTVTEGKRMLITQRPESALPAAKGYVRSSYLSGMTPNEEFSLSASVREGMAMTATISKNIGDTNRQLGRSLEPIKSKSGCSIFHETSILNFGYGGDSMNGLHLMKVGDSYQCADLTHIIHKINDRFVGTTPK